MKIKIVKGIGASGNDRIILNIAPNEANELVHDLEALQVMKPKLATTALFHGLKKQGFEGPKVERIVDKNQLSILEGM